MTYLKLIFKDWNLLSIFRSKLPPCSRVTDGNTDGWFQVGCAHSYYTHSASRKCSQCSSKSLVGILFQILERINIVMWHVNRSLQEIILGLHCRQDHLPYICHWVTDIALATEPIREGAREVLCRHQKEIRDHFPQTLYLPYKVSHIDHLETHLPFCSVNSPGESEPYETGQTLKE